MQWLDHIGHGSARREIVGPGATLYGMSWLDLIEFILGPHGLRPARAAARIVFVVLALFSMSTLVAIIMWIARMKAHDMLSQLGPLIPSPTPTR